MAAEATFILRAIDATKAAFASVQNSLAKTFQSDGPAKFAAKFLGIQHAASLIAAEIRHVIENIDSMPNVPAKTLESINELKYNLYKGRQELDKFILGGITMFANLGTNIGKVLGGLIYGFDAVSDSEKLVNIEAQKFADLPFKTKLLEISSGLEMLGKSQRQVAIILQDEVDALSNLAKTGVVDLGSLGNAYLKILKIKTDAAGGVGLKDRTDAEIKAEELKVKLIGLKLSISDKIALNTRKEHDQNVLFDERNLSAKQKLNKELEKRSQMEQTKRIPSPFEDISILEDYNRWLEKIITSNEKIDALNIQLEQTGKQAGQMIASSFEEAVFSGKKLSEILKALALDLVRLVFQKQVTEPLSSGISTFINNAFRASGGPVSSGSPYVVGEKGPELFVPNSSGSIIPNSKMGSGSGGAGGTNVNVTYNIASGVSRSDLAPILEQQRKLLKAEIPDMVRRGGGYRAAFA